MVVDAVEYHGFAMDDAVEYHGFAVYQNSVVSRSGPIARFVWTSYAVVVRMDPGVAFDTLL